MKRHLMPVYMTAALALATTSAFAQQSGQSDQPNQQKQAAQTEQQSGQPSNAQNAQHMAMTQGKLRKALQDAGFKSIRVIDASYLVQAQTQDGDSVLMFINPPQTTASKADNQQGGKNNSNSNNKSQ